MNEEKSLLHLLKKEDDAVKRYNNVIAYIEFENDEHEKRLINVDEEKKKFAIDFHNKELSRCNKRKEEAYKELKDTRYNLRKAFKDILI